MPRYLVGFFVVGIFLLSTGGCISTVFSEMFAEKPQVKDGRCKECGRDLPRGAACPYCLVQKLAAKKDEPRSAWKKASLPFKLTVFISTSLLCVLIAYRSWAPKINQEEVVEMFRFRCPKCERKIRYLAKKAGMPALCPGCREAFVLPEAPTQAE